LFNETIEPVHFFPHYIETYLQHDILYFVQPYSGNVNRRMIKSPKLYFYDTGLVCSLLNIETEKQLTSFYMRGNLFENFVFSELIKVRYNAGLPANLYFLRDSKGVEIDCVTELLDGMRFIEIKSSETLSPDHIKNIVLLGKLFPKTENYVIYSGKEEPVYHDVKFINWQNIERY
jgi:predicted AAA+ superfamily ATPase